MKIHDSNSGTFLSMIQFYICHDSRDFLKTAIENCIKTAGLYKSKNTITGPSYRLWMLEENMMIIQGVRYMTDFEAKKAILDIGKRMYDKGFVASNDGNISCKVGTNTIWTTPTGVSKGFMTQDMMVKMDLNGNILMGRYKPSSEVKMHLRVYRENPDVQAVTHAHPPVATSFAIAGIPLDKAVLTEAVMGLGTIPVARYATPGTRGSTGFYCSLCEYP